MAASTLPDAQIGLWRSDNAYDAVRLFLALFVVYTHSFRVQGSGESVLDSYFQHQIILGHIAVLAFFGLSGYLVAASRDNTPNLTHFFRKRLRRILPGFIGCLFVTAFILAPAIALARGNLHSFPVYGQGSASNYVLSNCLIAIRQQTIGGILAGLPDALNLNGSLWSLWPEFFCYIGLGVLGSAGGLSFNRPLLGFTTALLGVFHILRATNPHVLFPVMPVQLETPIFVPFFLSFAVGTCLYAWRDQFRPTVGASVVIGLVTLYLLRTGGFFIAAPVVIPLLVIFAGALVTMRLRHDLSYGIYIYSYPIQQLLTAAVPGLPWIAYLAASVALSTGFAAMSWFWIERGFTAGGTDRRKVNQVCLPITNLQSNP
jgi:peptidoglycan/LPS O-acetylase OafA/YrhL